MIADVVTVAVIGAVAVSFTAVGTMIGTLASSRSANRKISVDEGTTLRNEYRTDIAALRLEVKEAVEKNFTFERREVETAKLMVRLQLRVERLEELVREGRRKLAVLVLSHPEIAEFVADVDEVMSDGIIDRIGGLENYDERSNKGATTNSGLFPNDRKGL